MRWRSIDIWQPHGARLRRYRCMECLDRMVFVVVTMDYVTAKDSQARRAQQDSYYLEQLLELEVLPTATSLAAAIHAHDAMFENE